MAEPFEDDYKKILEKISQDKEDRHKNLEELKRRKKEIEKKALIESHSSNHAFRKDAPTVLHTQSAERKAINKKVYEHLQSPESKLPKQLKPHHQNRFEEDEVNLKNHAKESQINRLKMLDKRARYANIVKEIFAPTVDPAKREEVERRTDKTKTRSAFNSRGASPEQPAEFTPSLSQNNLRNTNTLANAAKQALSPRNYH